MAEEEKRNERDEKIKSEERKREKIRMVLRGKDYASYMRSGGSGWKRHVLRARASGRERDRIDNI